mgnify:CR=1 FL=1
MHQGAGNNQLVEWAYSYAAQQMAQGFTMQQVQQELVTAGLPPKAAVAVVNSVRNQQTGQTNLSGPPRKQGHSSSGVNDMVVGAIIALIGIVITGVTFALAEGGGTFVVAYGAIIFGGIQFFKGLINLGK